jgi:hypothetical protein
MVAAMSNPKGVAVPEQRPTEPCAWQRAILREFVRDARHTAAVVPSSPRLAAAMTLDVPSDGCHRSSSSWEP